MYSIEQAKQMATRLRTSLQAHDQPLSHSAALEVVAQQLGHRDWNTASAQLRKQVVAPAGITFDQAIPLFRMFDEAKAREFYLGFLGFSVAFEHRFEPGQPLYLGIKRGALHLHLTEHHGDANPGATLFVPMQNIESLRDELHAKGYGYARPAIVQQGWGKVLEVYDPFGNRIRFCEG